MEPFTFQWQFSDPAFPFVMSAVRRDDYSFPLHSHHHCELAVILGGRGAHLVNGVEYAITAGDVFVFTPEAVHAYEHLQDIHLVNIMFDPAVLGADGEALRKLPGYHALFVLEPSYRQRHTFRSHLHIAFAELPAIAALLAQMQKEFDAARPGYQVLVRSLLLQLIVYCARAYSKAPQSQLLIQLGEVISYIEHAYTEPLTLHNIAEKANMSERTLIRRFKEGMGISPIEYVIQLRVQRGVELLRERTATISEIAYTVGFTDSNYFSRQFKRMMGITPREFIGATGG